MYTPRSLRSAFTFCMLYAVVCMAFVLGLLLLDPLLASAQAPPIKPDPVSFINDVAPILKENCFACHDAKKRKGKFDMTTYENFRKGGDHDDPVAAGKPEESHLIDVLNAKDGSRMPPPKDIPEQLPKEK